MSRLDMKTIPSVDDLTRAIDVFASLGNHQTVVRATAIMMALRDARKLIDEFAAMGSGDAAGLNVAVGHNAGMHLSRGSCNIFYGPNAGDAVTDDSLILEIRA